MIPRSAARRGLSQSVEGRAQSASGRLSHRQCRRGNRTTSYGRAPGWAGAAEARVEPEARRAGRGRGWLGQLES